MSLPYSLQQAIEELISAQNLTNLAAAAQEVSSRYRNPHSPQLLSTPLHRLAYLAMRLPATYEAVHAVGQELSKHLPGALMSMLDIGAGPGTGMWAMADLFPSIQKISLIEQDAAFLDLGKKIAAHSNCQAIQSASWHTADITKAEKLAVHDLILFSYSLGELPKKILRPLMQFCWEITQKALIIVEPGTPKGYETIMQVRDILIELGGNLLAPCPHAHQCPMVGTKDWCHFSARVARSSTHRFIKNALLGHEDEKFSYVIFAKNFHHSAEERVVRHPLKKSGHVHLELCTKQGLQKTIISKKTK